MEVSHLTQWPLSLHHLRAWQMCAAEVMNDGNKMEKVRSTMVVSVSLASKKLSAKAEVLSM
eukprot:1148812-Pelagomonas_calceolata.AAC.13